MKAKMTAVGAAAAAAVRRMGAAVDTNPVPTTAQPSSPVVPQVPASTVEILYPSASDALKAVRDDYLYWTGRLTDTSLQLAFAVIAANWAVFGSQIFAKFWSKLSVGLVIVSLVFGLAGAKWMGELHRKRIEYAETDPSRWQAEFRDTAGKFNPWPFTRKIEWVGRRMRSAKTWLPLIAGISFLVALVRR
jgi:hypothetical protein